MYINRTQDLSKEARLRAVETLFLSYINYGISVWSTANITQLKRVKDYKTLMPKWPLAEPSNHATPLMNKLQWLPIRKEVIYEQCPTTFKIYEQSALFCWTQVGNVSSANTRQQNPLHIPRTKTHRLWITVRGPKLWNNLPSNVKECSSLQALKDELETSYYTAISP